jgi:AcrR family transcriptional regulator
LRELARQAGVTPAAPYHHFASKTAVLDEIASVGFQRLDAALTRAVSTAAPPATRLTKMVLAYLKFASEHASHYQLMFPPGLGTAETHGPLRVVAAGAFTRLLRAVREVRPAAKEDDLFWAFSVWALCHGFLRMERDGLLGADLTIGPFDRIVPRIAALSAELVTNAGAKKAAVKSAASAGRSRSAKVPSARKR